MLNVFVDDDERFSSILSLIVSVVELSLSALMGRSLANLPLLNDITS